LEKYKNKKIKNERSCIIMYENNYYFNKLLWGINNKGALLSFDGMKRKWYKRTEMRKNQKKKKKKKATGNLRAQRREQKKDFLTSLTALFN